MPIALVVHYDGEEQVLQVNDEDIILFPNGLVGFPEWRRFTLLVDPDEGPIGVLQCLDDSAVSFLVADPVCVTSDYHPEVPVDDLEQLGLRSIADGRMLCILVPRDGPVRVTANLLGPIVINPRTRMGRQVVLPDARYSAQHPVLVAQGLA